MLSEKNRAMQSRLTHDKQWMRTVASSEGEAKKKSINRKINSDLYDIFWGVTRVRRLAGSLPRG